MENPLGSVKVTIEPAVAGIPKSFDVSFTTAMEMLHLVGMGTWEGTAPPPGQSGYKEDVWMENSQQARLQYLLIGIGKSNPDHDYGVLAERTRRQHSWESSVTRARPVQSLALNDRWYLDVCLNLPQKLQIVDALKHLGFSRAFIEAAKRFVAGEPLHRNVAH